MTQRQSLTARDIMHGDAVCVPAHETLDRAAQRMRELDVGALPICDNDRLTGTITDRDIVVKCVAAGRDPAQVRASDLAEGTPRWVDVDADVREILDLMERHQVRRLPVIDVEGGRRLVGIISESDLGRNIGHDQLTEFVSKVFTPH